jgi:hypothetical protein
MLLPCALSTPPSHPPCCTSLQALPSTLSCVPASPPPCCSLQALPSTLSGLRSLTISLLDIGQVELLAQLAALTSLSFIEKGEDAGTERPLHNVITQLTTLRCLRHFSATTLKHTVKLTGQASARVAGRWQCIGLPHRSAPAKPASPPTMTVSHVSTVSCGVSCCPDASCLSSQRRWWKRWPLDGHTWRASPLPACCGCPTQRRPPLGASASSACCH